MRIMCSVIYYAVWEFFYVMLPLSPNPELSIKEEYRMEPTEEFVYADKMIWPRPLAPKINGETVVQGDLIEREELKSYFENPARFKKLKYVAWKTTNVILTNVREYESTNPVFHEIKKIYDDKYKPPKDEE